MAISFPSFMPELNPIAPPDVPDFGGEFTKSVIQGYQAGQVMSGAARALDDLKLAALKQAYEQGGQEFPLRIAQLQGQIANQPVARAETVSKILGEPGTVTNADTGPRIPVGNSPMALTERWAAPEGGGQVPADAVSVGLPGQPGVARSPFLRQQEEIDKEQRSTERLMALVGARTEGAKEVAEFKNKLSGANNVDPAVLKGMLEQTRVYGTVPSFGLGQSGLRTAYYAALGGADPEAAGVLEEGALNKAVRAGQSRAYATQQNLYQGTKSSIKTFEKQLTLAQQLSNRVDRTGSPVLNRYLLMLNGKYAGDEDTIAFGNAVQTAANEFARILNGSVASIAGSTVSSVEDAKQLINTALTKGQFDAVANLMRLESGYRLKSYEDTLKELEGSIGKIGNNPTESSTEKSSEDKPRFTIRRKQ